MKRLRIISLILFTTANQLYSQINTSINAYSSLPFLPQDLIITSIIEVEKCQYHIELISSDSNFQFFSTENIDIKKGSNQYHLNYTEKINDSTFNLLYINKYIPNISINYSLKITDSLNQIIYLDRETIEIINTVFNESLFDSLNLLADIEFYNNTQGGAISSKQAADSVVYASYCLFNQAEGKKASTLEKEKPINKYLTISNTSLFLSSEFQNRNLPGDLYTYPYAQIGGTSTISISKRPFTISGALFLMNENENLFNSAFNYFNVDYNHDVLVQEQLKNLNRSELEAKLNDQKENLFNTYLTEKEKFNQELEKFPDSLHTQFKKMIEDTLHHSINYNDFLKDSLKQSGLSNKEIKSLLKYKQRFSEILKEKESLDQLLSIDSSMLPAINKDQLTSLLSQVDQPRIEDLSLGNITPYKNTGSALPSFSPKLKGAQSEIALNDQLSLQLGFASFAENFLTIQDSSFFIMTGVVYRKDRLKVTSNFNYRNNINAENILLDKNSLNQSTGVELSLFKGLDIGVIVDSYHPLSNKLTIQENYRSEQYINVSLNNTTSMKFYFEQTESNFQNPLELNYTPNTHRYGGEIESTIPKIHTTLLLGLNSQQNNNKSRLRSLAWNARFQTSFNKWPNISFAYSPFIRINDVVSTVGESLPIPPSNQTEMYLLQLSYNTILGNQKVSSLVSYSMLKSNTQENNTSLTSNNYRNESILAQLNLFTPKSLATLSFTSFKNSTSDIQPSIMSLQYLRKITSLSSIGLESRYGKRESNRTTYAGIVIQIKISNPIALKYSAGYYFESSTPPNFSTRVYMTYSLW